MAFRRARLAVSGLFAARDPGGAGSGPGVGGVERVCVGL